MTVKTKKKRGPPPGPYTSRVTRVPTPILPTILAMVAEYRAKAWAEARERNSRP